MSRREKLFLNWALSVTILVVALMAVVIVFALPRVPTRVSIGRVETFPLDSVTDVFLPVDFPDPFGLGNTAHAFVVRDARGRFTAFLARSTHLGEPIVWDSRIQRFVSPAHGEKWTRDGKYYEGPAPRDLDRFPVAVADSEVFIELRLIKGAPLPQPLGTPPPAPPLFTPAPAHTPTP